MKTLLDRLAVCLGIVGGCIAIFQFVASDQVSSPWFKALIERREVPPWFTSGWHWVEGIRHALPGWATLCGLAAMVALALNAVMLVARAKRVQLWKPLLLAALVWFLWPSIPVWALLLTAVLTVAYGMILTAA